LSSFVIKIGSDIEDASFLPSHRIAYSIPEWMCHWSCFGVMVSA
jgi:hypothetical protein